MKHLAASLATLMLVMTLTATGVGIPEASEIDETGTYLDWEGLPWEDATVKTLGRPSPDWYTDEIHTAVVEAAEQGMAYDVKDQVAVPLSTGMIGIRPGGWMVFPSWCTMAFVYDNPDPNRDPAIFSPYTMATAGHCTKNENDVVAMHIHPNVVAAVGLTTNTTGDKGIGKDWALVNITKPFEDIVNPTTPIGGPQGTYCGSPNLLSPVPVKHFGHGVGIGTGGTPRSGTSSFMDPPFNASGGLPEPAFYLHTLAAPGDSGSPVLTATMTQAPFGLEVGILTHLVIFGPNLQIVAGTRTCQFPSPFPPLVTGTLTIP